MGSSFAIYRHHNTFLIKHLPSPLVLLSPSPLMCRKRTCQIRRRISLVVHSKSSPSFQDFQGYINPLRLLPATEPEVLTDSLLENILRPLEVDGSGCFYTVKLRTSGTYGSCLSDLNSGILICLVDEKGESILQRIPAISSRNHSDQSNGNDNSDSVHFRRGSYDEFTFRGPKLGKIDALWIGLESGQWRLGGASLIVTYRNQFTSDENSRKEMKFIGTEYTFEIDDTLLGEGSDSTMVELRPCLVKEFIGDNIISLSENLFQSTPTIHDGILKEESMKEYANLKLSLLLYDAFFVLSGSSIASFLVGRNSAIAFSVGGAIGFLYLLLLQRSVDGLPAPGTVQVKNKGEIGEIFGKFKGPVLSLVSAFTFAVIAVKYGSGDSSDMVVLTPKEVMSGMLGFLVCKVAVVLAAFKTMPITMEDK